MIFYVHKILSVTDFQPFLYIKKHNLLLLDHLTSCTPIRSKTVATVSSNAVLQTSLTLKYCRQTTKEPGLPFRPSLADIHQLSLPPYLWNAWTNDKNETQVFTTVNIITIFWYVTQYSSGDTRRYGGVCCLHLRSRRYLLPCLDCSTFLRTVGTRVPLHKCD